MDDDAKDAVKAWTDIAGGAELRRETVAGQMTIFYPNGAFWRLSAGAYKDMVAMARYVIKANPENMEPVENRSNREPEQGEY